MESNCKKTEALAQRVRDLLAANYTRNAEIIRCKLKKTSPVPMSIIRAVLAEHGDDQVPAYSVALGKVRVAAKKPNEGLKARIYALRRGRAYPVDGLANEWCVSPESVATWARRCNALRYVEVTPGEWKPCALHPDTAAEYES